jgi:hypothetical protein
MYYHKTFFFDYERYLITVKPIRKLAVNNDIHSVRDQVSELIHSPGRENRPVNSFFDAEYQAALREFSPDSEHIHQEIGLRLFVLLSSNLLLCPVNLGADWRNLRLLLRFQYVSETDIELLTRGIPTSYFFTDEISHMKAIDHSDPFWMWIHPLASVNPGGWLSLEACRDLLRTLNKIDTQHIDVPLEALKTRNFQLESALDGLKNAVRILSLADNTALGIYMAVFWI